MQQLESFHVYLRHVLSAAGVHDLPLPEIEALRTMFTALVATAPEPVAKELRGPSAFSKPFQALTRGLTPREVGLLDFYVKREANRNVFGGGFNGQQFRRKIFMELMKFGFEAIVETGTFCGDTTEYMVEHSELAVYSSEANERWYTFVERCLRPVSRALVTHEDSRTHLQRLARDPFFPKARIFFYLDAHWIRDLPLAEELDIISSAWTDAIVMIDDFEVPGDPGYRFDDYGPGKRLCLEYLRLPERRRFSAHWPSAPSSQETSARRGCVVLAMPGAPESFARTLETLR